MNVTLVCLVLLFILTLGGTIDQAHNGLYLARERFFHSIFFLWGGWLPFPGARLVLGVLFLNLVCVALARLVYTWSRAGLVIAHFGLLLFFVAAFVTYYGTQESSLTLMEGEGSNVSSAYYDWEVSVWAEEGKETGMEGRAKQGSSASDGRLMRIQQRKVMAYDAGGLGPGKKLNFQPFGFSLDVIKYYPNSEAYDRGDGSSPMTGTPQEAGDINRSGIKELKPLATDKEPANNLPGGIFSVTGKGHASGGQGNDKGRRLLLYGGDPVPVKFEEGGHSYFVQLRRKRLPLPFVLRLKDFMMEMHPNTAMARSYKSRVEILRKEGLSAQRASGQAGGLPVNSQIGSREVVISMNNPLRYKDFTLYQSSYAIDPFGRESSTLAVVQNAGRVLPYLASFVTFAGLALHLLLKAFRAVERRSP